LFNALEHAVEATFKGYKSNINALVVDAAKQVWNICVRLQESQKNRAKLLNPLRATLFYLK
jgi:flagellar biosynthesis/type III secretory pathway protein FliH